MNPVDGMPAWQYLTWLSGHAVFSTQAEGLLLWAAHNRVEVFVAWEMDHHDQRVAQLLVQRSGDEWIFTEQDGGVRRIVTHPEVTVNERDDFLDWVVTFFDQFFVEMSAIPLPRAVWEEDHERIDFYAPYGFAPPEMVVHPADPTQQRWICEWCPQIVGEQISTLTNDQRALYLRAMYLRLSWAIEPEMQALDPAERERQLDLRLCENLSISGVVNLVQMKAMDRRANHE